MDTRGLGRLKNCSLTAFAAAMFLLAALLSACSNASAGSDPEEFSATIIAAVNTSAGEAEANKLARRLGQLGQNDSQGGVSQSPVPGQGPVATATPAFNDQGREIEEALLRAQQSVVKVSYGETAGAGLVFSVNHETGSAIVITSIPLASVAGGVSVHLGGDRYPATLIAGDEKSAIMVLGVCCSPDFVSAETAARSMVGPGRPVFFFGFTDPGQVEPERGQGLIKTVIFDRQGLPSELQFLPNNTARGAGGPLFTSDGKMVGLAITDPRRASQLSASGLAAASSFHSIDSIVAGLGGQQPSPSATAVTQPTPTPAAPVTPVPTPTPLPTPAPSPTPVPTAVPTPSPSATATATPPASSPSPSPTAVPTLAPTPSPTATPAPSSQFVEQKPLFGPASGDLMHNTAGDGPVVAAAGLSVKNFYASATFTNPFDAASRKWNYGFNFRGTESDTFFIVVDGAKSWQLVRRRVTLVGATNRRIVSTTTIVQGQVAGLETGAGQSNKISFIARDSTGWLYVNDRLIASMSLAAIQASGDVQAVTGIFKDDEFSLSATGYGDFVVHDFASRPAAASGQLRPGDALSTGVLATGMAAEVTFRVPTPSYTAPWSWGVEVRSASGGVTRYVIRSDRTLTIARFEPGADDAAEEMAGSPWEAVNASADGPNRVLMLVTDGSINLYLNGVYSLISLPLNEDGPFSIALLGSMAEGTPADLTVNYSGLGIWTFGQ